MTTSSAFEQADLALQLNSCTAADLDTLDFGAIGFDTEGTVRLYNAFEAKAAGLSAQNVIGADLFNTVAPCMNNFMVAQRFEDAAEGGVALDAVIDYVLTLRMRPVRVKLRLLASPGHAFRYVLVQRSL